MELSMNDLSAVEYSVDALLICLRDKTVLKEDSIVAFKDSLIEAADIVHNCLSNPDLHINDSGLSEYDRLLLCIRGDLIAATSFLLMGFIDEVVRNLASAKSAIAGIKSLGE